MKPIAVIATKRDCTWTQVATCYKSMMALTEGVGYERISKQQ